MKNISFLSKLFALGFLITSVAGCATNLTKPKESPQPSQVKFGKFDRVEVKEVGIAEKFANVGANEKARRKINELLQNEMKRIFSGAKSVTIVKEFTNEKGVLQIAPKIEEIKFISGAVRFWVGAMAGGSAVLMRVEYNDGANGKLLAAPQFYCDVSAFGGAITFGFKDNQILSEVASDIAHYTSSNR